MKRCMTVAVLCMFCGVLFAEEPKAKSDVFITNYGLFCFSIAVDDRVVLTDPFDTETVALSTPTVNPSIVILSHMQTKKSVFELLKGTYHVIKSNGFYRVMAIPFNGFKLNEGNIAYTWEMGELKFAYLGNFRAVEFNEQILFRFKNTDVLFFPVGSYSADTEQTAWALIDKINPKIVIPMYYKLPEISKQRVPAELEPFLAAQKDRVVMIKDRIFIVNKDTLPKERTVFVLPYKEEEIQKKKEE